MMDKQSKIKFLIDELGYSEDDAKTFVKEAIRPKPKREKLNKVKHLIKTYNFSEVDAIKIDSNLNYIAHIEQVQKNKGNIQKDNKKAVELICNAKPQPQDLIHGMESEPFSYTQIQRPQISEVQFIINKKRVSIDDPDIIEKIRIRLTDEDIVPQSKADAHRPTKEYKKGLKGITPFILRCLPESNTKEINIVLIAEIFSLYLESYRDDRKDRVVKYSQDIKNLLKKK